MTIQYFPFACLMAVQIINRSLSMRNPIQFLMLAITVVSISGCNIHVTAGYKPDLTALESRLKQGQSTQQDVQKMLGEPVGKGKEMFPFMDQPRITWTYYYEEGDIKDDRRLFLFVFFDNQRHDGYLWFSSLPVN